MALKDGSGASNGHLSDGSVSPTAPIAKVNEEDGGTRGGGGLGLGPGSGPGSGSGQQRRLMRGVSLRDSYEELIMGSPPVSSR